MVKSKTKGEIALEKKKKKAKAKKIIGIIVLVAIIAVVFFYQDIKNTIFSQPQVCLNATNSNQSSTSVSDAYGAVKGTVSGLLESDRYSWFIKLLIFLGAIYIIQIALSAMFDVVEILALLYLLVTKIYKGICKLFRRKKRNE